MTDHGTSDASGTVITVDAANAGFAPTCVTNVPRGDVRLVVHNSGAVLHDVQVRAQHVDVDVEPGRSATVRLHVGTVPLVYVCRYHRYLGMVGILIPRH